MKTFFLSIVFFTIALLSCNQAPHTKDTGERLYSEKELQADLDSLYAGINNIHPNMFAFISKEEFEAAFKKVKEQLNKPMTITEFYVTVAPLITKLCDGHTNLYLPLNEFQKYGKNLFPLSVKTPNDSTLLVNRSFMDIPEGAMISSINKVSAGELIRKNLEYASGELEFYRLSKVPSLFTWTLWAVYQWENFDIVYTYEGKTHSDTLAGMPLDEIYAQNKEENTTTYADFSFKKVDNTIGLIDFRSFYDMAAFSKFLHTTFDTLKRDNIKNLIIDIRNNGGGNSQLGDSLFQYISYVPYQQYGNTTIKYSRERYNFYKYKVRDTWFKHVSDKDFNRILKNGKIGAIQTEGNDKLIKIKSNLLRYNGNVYLLTSHHSFSSASDFAWAFKYFKMGKIVGEETGGLAVCFGDIICPELPNTKLAYGVSHKKFYSFGATEEDSKHGILPDYSVDEKDALNYTINLIKQTQ